MKTHRMMPLMVNFLLLVWLYAGIAQAQYLEAPYSRSNLPSQQAEELLAPKPLTRAPATGGVTATTQTLFFRPGLTAIMLADDGTPTLIARNRQRYTLGFDPGGEMGMVPEAADKPRLVPARDVIPDALPGHGQRDIRDVWLIQPTNRYINGVLGDVIEAAALRVMLQDGHFIVQRAEGPSVYEDLHPRVADVNGDGHDDILVVRSTADQGASLVIYTLVPGPNGRMVLQQLAATPSMNQPKAWLNPVGVGDFDGDGNVEIAVVERPYDLGQLSIWRLQQGRLIRLGAMTGFSNHKMGVPQIDMAVVQDINNDGVVDLIVPASDRKSLRLVTFKGGNLAVIGNIPLRAPVKTNMYWVQNGVLAGLEDNNIVHVRFNAR